MFKLFLCGNSLNESELFVYIFNILGCLSVFWCKMNFVLLFLFTYVVASSSDRFASFRFSFAFFLKLIFIFIGLYVILNENIVYVFVSIVGFVYCVIVFFISGMMFF